jgi:YHS domain-containing protein
LGGEAGLPVAPARRMTMKSYLNLCVIAATLGFAAGCATQPEQAASSGPTATCHVCRYNHDLACVTVRVKDSTPRAEYQGRTYYFCSEECRTEFLAKPAKYLPKPER